MLAVCLLVDQFYHLIHLDVLYVHRQSAYLIGRDRKVGVSGIALVWWSQTLLHKQIGSGDLCKLRNRVWFRQTSIALC